ncbi:MAG: ABC transporter substrate-binding protein, partial [Actinomycetota bacterium]
MRPVVVMVATVFILGACTEEPGVRGSASRPARSVAHVKIAFLHDLSAGDAALRTAPAFQGAKLAFDTAGLSGDLEVEVELVALNTQGDPETATLVAGKVAADPAFVGAIGAPFLTAQRAVGDILDGAEVPTITLSTLGPDLAKAGWTTWRRVVADHARMGSAVAAFVDSLPGGKRSACLLGDGSRGASGLLRSAAGELRTPMVLRSRVVEDDREPAGVADAVRNAGCGVVIWGGLSGQGALVRMRLVEGGLRRVAFVGADGMKDGIY